MQNKLVQDHAFRQYSFGDDRTDVLLMGILKLSRLVMTLKDSNKLHMKTSVSRAWLHDHTSFVRIQSSSFQLFLWALANVLLNLFFFFCSDVKSMRKWIPSLILAMTAISCIKLPASISCSPSYLCLCLVCSITSATVMPAKHKQCR